MIALAIRYWWVFLVAGLLVANGFQRIQVVNAKGALADLRVKVADERTRAAQAAQAAEKAARETEQRREAATREVIKNAQDRNKAVQADADTARSDGERMRQRIAALERTARSATSNPASAARGSDQQGSDPIGMFAKLSGGADALAEIYAGIADGRRVTAEACERAGDALGR